MASKPRQSGGGNDFTLVSNYTLGYRHREDKTNLPPGVLVVGSQNVLTNTAERVAIRKGYTLDGAASAVIAPIASSYDWDMRAGQRNLRAGFMTTGSDGRLQYRYVDSLGVVTWRDLMTSLTSVNFNFTTFWDFNTELKDLLLFVNGTSNIYEWSGGVATYASSTINTITVEGSSTLGQLNFYTASPFGSIVIGGITYAYTGVSGTQFTGVTPDPTGGGHVAGDVIHQAVRTTANSSITDLPATFPNALIANLRNQIYIGSLTDNDVYISMVNDYTDYSFTQPVRLVGEGALVTLDGAAVAFVPQEDKMCISAGKDQWYETKFTLSSDLTAEAFQITRLKTASLQATQSQAATSNSKNDIIFISNEPSLLTLGRVKDVVITQQTENISDPIKNDFDVYDFTDASIAYHRQLIYIAVPAESRVLIWNIFKGFWEAPQIMPISRFAVIDGELYGHSYQTSETYKLFDGYNDNGVPIEASAVFSYNNFGSRSKKKGLNEFYSEGYISSNTTLNLGIMYEIDGCATDTTYPIQGNNRQFVCVGGEDNSLGKNSLGKEPLGSLSFTQSPNDLPPKFRWIRTFSEQYFYEMQVSFSSNGLDQQWEILAFGPKILLAGDQNNAIKE